MQRGLICVCVLMIITIAHVVGHDLRITVTPTRAKFHRKQDVEAILKYKNTGSDEISIYKWYVPTETLSDPLFEVTQDGKRVNYVGPLVKRRAPGAEDMIFLEPGKEISTRVQLSDVYDMTVTGNYEVRFNPNIDPISSVSTRALNDADSSSDEISNTRSVSSTATLFAVGRSNALIEESARAAVQRRGSTYTFNSCSASRQSAIITAIRSGATYSSSTIQYLASVRSSGTTRYNTWFGAYSSGNLQTLKSHFTRIQDVFNTKPMSFDCSCADQNTFAKVYPSIPYKIHLCPLFWTAPATGIDTKGGTLIHEISHFTVVAGTDDYAYGHSKCKALAQSSPTKAVNNADNHQYFSENYPALK